MKLKKMINFGLNINNILIEIIIFIIIFYNYVLDFKNKQIFFLFNN